MNWSEFAILGHDKRSMIYRYPWTFLTTSNVINFWSQPFTFSDERSFPYRIQNFSVDDISYILYHFKTAQFRTGVLFKNPLGSVQLLKYRRNWVRVLEIRFIQSLRKKQQYFIKINSRSAQIFRLDEASQLWVGLQKQDTRKRGRVYLFYTTANEEIQTFKTIMAN